MQKKDNRHKGISRRNFIKGATAATAMLGVPFIPRRALARPTKQELVVAWDASGTAGWDFHKATQKTQEKGPSNSCYNGILEFDRRKVDLDLIYPALATDWDMSKDQTEWTFKLRKGVHWHNNYGVDWGEFTSEDVVFSLTRSRKFKGRKQYPADARFHTRLTNTPLKLKLKAPMSRLDMLGMMTKPPQSYMMCKKALEKLGADYGLKPVGTGFFEA